VKAFILAGPTAVGKTAVAHALARQMKLPILSTDSMLVYRGMDIGTAKPSLSERGGIPYFGIDLVDPDTAFSTGDYLRAVTGSCETCIATGGTGLYIKALSMGLEELPQGDPDRRAALEAMELPALQDLLRSLDAVWLAEIADPQNPRRLVRAIELAEAGVPRPKAFVNQPRVALVGLSMDRDLLRERIALRVDQMMAHGLVEEVRELRTRFPVWSSTAEQAIGYAEVIQLIEGTLSMKDAVQRIVNRTRQYAKRQKTWFNNQFELTKVEIHPEDDPEETALKVRAYWERTGPVPICE
jgi:tRNA dimethylallyltransferase